MKTFKLLLLLATTCIVSVYAETSQKEMISLAISSYEKALNESSVDGIASLFSEDGVLILQGAPTFVGKDEVKEFYAGLFQNLKFDLRFKIDEIVEMSDEWAFVRTTTSGTLDIIANHSSIPSSGHELFIFKKQNDGTWAIARYAGSSTK